MRRIALYCPLQTIKSSSAVRVLMSTDQRVIKQADFRDLLIANIGNIGKSQYLQSFIGAKKK